MAASTCENAETSVLSQTLDDEADEWLFSSINDYSDLYMYEFQHPTRSLTWISDDRVCVACLLPESRSEILEMILPERLLAQTDEKALLRGRDFKVLSGGFNDRHIYDVQFVKNTRKVITNEKGENLIRLWQLGDEEYDVIEKNGEIHSSLPDCRAACISLNDDGDSFLFGTKLKNVEEVKLPVLQKQWCLKSGDDKEMNSGVLSGIEYLTTDTFATYERNSGDINVFDKRQNSSRSLHIPAHEDTRSPCVFTKSQLGDAAVAFAVLDSRGIITTWDSRSIDKPVHHANINLQNTRGDTIQIQFAKYNSNTLSVSGFDGNVYIYETLEWSQKESNCPVVKPTFIHKGHEVCLDEDYTGVLTVLHHAWHPSQTQLVLSAASDGSLHAWNYNTHLTPTDGKGMPDGQDESKDVPDGQDESKDMPDGQDESKDSRRAVSDTGEKSDNSEN